MTQNSGRAPGRLQTRPARSAALSVGGAAARLALGCLAVAVGLIAHTPGTARYGWGAALAQGGGQPTGQPAKSNPGRAPVAKGYVPPPQAITWPGALGITPFPTPVQTGITERFGPPVIPMTEEQFLFPRYAVDDWPAEDRARFRDEAYVRAHPYARSAAVMTQYCALEYEWRLISDFANKEIGQGPKHALLPGYRFTVIERPALYGIPQTAPLGVFSKSLQAKYPVGRPGFMIAGDEVIIRRILERVGPEATGDPMLWETVYEIEIPTQDNKITYFSSYFASQALPTGVDLAPHWFHAHRNFEALEYARTRKRLIDDLGLDPIWVLRVAEVSRWYRESWLQQNCPPQFRPS